MPCEAAHSCAKPKKLKYVPECFFEAIGFEAGKQCNNKNGSHCSKNTSQAECNNSIIYYVLIWKSIINTSFQKPKVCTYRVAHMYLNDFVRLFRGHWVT